MLDAYALIALLKDEPAADEVESLLRGADRAAVVATNLTETLDSLMRREGLSYEEATGALDPILDDTVAVLDVTRKVAIRAAELRAKHYKKGVSELSLADCLLLATAQGGDRIASNDEPIEKAAESEEIQFVRLS